MRHILKTFGSEAAQNLRRAETPLARIEAILAASFSAENFKPATISAWLNFYVLANSSDEAHRLLMVYQRRLHSNLRFALRSLSDQPHALAVQIAALIDGLYLRAALDASKTATSEKTSRDAVHALLSQGMRP